MIYFIWSDFAKKVKIGHHEDPWVYIRKLQPAHAWSLTLLPVKNGGVARAKTIKKMFQSEQRYGDWFTLSKRLRAFIFNHEEVGPSIANGLDLDEELSLRNAGKALGLSRTTIARIRDRLGLERITVGDLPQIERNAYANVRRGKFKGVTTKEAR